MKTLFRFALTIGAAALLAGCGGSQSPIGAPSAMQQSRAIATHANRGGSWMTPDAKSGALLYASFISTDSVVVWTYPKGRIVGTLTGTGNPSGLCSDNQGNVYVINEANANITVYAHGGTAPIATLNDSGYLPLGCSFDPMSGNLAVANYEGYPGGSQGNIAIYNGARGTPTLYTNPDMYTYYSCGYDDKGNLFVTSNSGTAEFAELPRGNSSFIYLSVPFTGLGDIQWDGRYLAVGSYSPANPGYSIYRLRVSGSTVHVEGTVTIKRQKGKVRLRSFWIGGHKLVGAFTELIGSWRYPDAGSPRLIVRRYGTTQGVTVSFPPSH